MSNLALNDRSDFDKEIALFRTFINVRPGPKPAISEEAWQSFYASTNEKEQPKSEAA